MSEVPSLREAAQRLLAAIDGSPGAAETADAVNAMRAALARGDRSAPAPLPPDYEQTLAKVREELRPLTDPIRASARITGDDLNIRVTGAGAALRQDAGRTLKVFVDDAITGVPDRELDDNEAAAEDATWD